MPKQTYHHGDLRATLLALTRAHIAREGVDTLSVRALAKEAGVAHRAAYQHFPDKDGLIAAALTEAYRRLGAMCESSLVGAADLEAQLLAVARAYAAFAAAEPQMFLAMTGPRINRSGVHVELEAAIAQAWRRVAGPIGEGVDRGVFTSKDKRAAAALFWGGLVGVLTQAALGRLKVNSSECAEFLDDVARRLIAGLKAD